MYHCVKLGFYSSSWSTVGLMVRVGEESEIFSSPFYLGYIAKMVPRAAGFIFSKRIYEVAHVLLSKATCYRQLLPR